MRAFLTEEGMESNGWVAFTALGQQRAKALQITKAEAGIGKSASWIDWFRKRPQHFEMEERGTQSRARLKPAK